MTFFRSDVLIMLTYDAAVVKEAGGIEGVYQGKKLWPRPQCYQHVVLYTMVTTVYN